MDIFKSIPIKKNGNKQDIDLILNLVVVHITQKALNQQVSEIQYYKSSVEFTQRSVNPMYSIQGVL